MRSAGSRRGGSTSRQRSRSLILGFNASIAASLTALALAIPGLAEYHTEPSIGFSAEPPTAIHQMEGIVAFRPQDTPKDRFLVFGAGHEIEDNLDVPPLPPGGRLLVVLDAIPTLDVNGVPVDNWTRPARVVAQTPFGDLELIRAMTGYGAGGRFVQDITALAPALGTRCTLRAGLAGYPKVPTWTVRVQLVTEVQGAAHRNPGYCQPLWLEDVLLPNGSISQTITIPGELRAPRILLRSTGHSATGSAYHEFVSLTHVLKVDGLEVARYRPWQEDGGTARRLNPAAGVPDPDQPSLLASDLDRSGWTPGRMVAPLVLPLPELTPGRHTVTLEVLGGRPPKGLNQPIEGYWMQSAVVIADDQVLAPSPGTR